MTQRVWLNRYRADVGIAFALFLFALLLRLPYLYLVPTWADDMSESRYAMQVAQGMQSPFLGMVPYTGPIHTGIMALFLKVYQDPYVPRAVNLVFASLTIPATYFFGRSYHNRAAGIVAALLLATSSTHIVVNSHYAYSSAVTPFFTTLACLALLVAQKRNSIGFLGLAGVLLALAMQTHPVAVVMAPGMVLWFWSYRDHWSWFRRPALYVAGLVTFLAYAPVLYAILINPRGFRSSVASRTYAIETNQSPLTYLGNLQNLIVELVRMVGAHYDGASRPLLYLADPFVLCYVLLVPAAVIVAVRHKRTLPVFALGSAAAIIPFYLYQYDAFPYFTRYVAFLLPIIYVLVGSLAVQAWIWFSTQAPLRARAVQSAATLVIFLFVVVLVAVPVQRTAQYYAGRVAAGATNAPFLEIVQRLDSDRSVLILVDASLDAGELVGGGNLGRSFRAWFRIENRPFGRVRLVTNPHVEICNTGRTFLIATTTAAAVLSPRCSLIPLLEYNILTRPGRPRLEYGLYEIGLAATLP